MNLAEIIATVAIVLAVGGAVFYIVLSKKKGKKCIGCPYAGSCRGGCSCSEAKDGMKSERPDE